MKVEEIKLAFNTNIQFAISDDLKSSVSSIDGATASINKSIANYDTAYKAMQAETTKAKALADKAAKLTAVAVQKASELGVPVNSIPGYNELLKAWQVNQTAIDKVNEF